MEQFLFIIAMVSLAGAVILFIAGILNQGINGVREIGKWLTVLFLLYVVTYLIYLSFQLI
ncbi:hypothetical protein D7Z54_02395 [Salibacterium salarium]|uniref:Uncharacterized protein n=1 Tax=Salibacterium salarium TaxID=284579 RepID=A0A3R9QW84_9BACI|nr:hypothetical protein [Salibacterium salarium]RSL34711.1 hypothetical protein D7Z54_02395 [Salibacterium salarium]